MNLNLTPIPGIPAVTPGADLAQLLLSAINNAGLSLSTGDIIVICQKIVSKAEGRIAHLQDIVPSAFAKHIAAQTTDKDPRVVEVILHEAQRIIKMDRGHLIVETGP